jgi:hypothetical protein
MLVYRVKPEATPADVCEAAINALVALDECDHTDVGTCDACTVRAIGALTQAVTADADADTKEP